ncbi:MAG: potassium transporter TrkA [Melioribacteraceae bacterium]|nr:MAG: potassium transporter TrkA [Melioribacteraceae bacterium]
MDQIRNGLFFLLFTVITGTIGYMMIENWSVLDSLYMTVISITTTGFAELKPLSASGRLFTIFLIILGVTSIAYIGGRVAQVFIENQFFRSRRMNKRLDTIGNHYIVCGYGRMGKTICEGLVENDVPFVIVENSQQKVDVILAKNWLCVMGDATNDETLLEAGIKRAKGLVAVIRTDAENVFAALSAKELNPDVFVVARAIDEGTESKLKKAGADRVVKPYDLGGNRMVQLLLRPGVIDFIDGVARNRSLNISLEEIQVSVNSSLSGTTLLDSPVRKDLDIIIIAISKNTGEFMYNPKSTTRIEGNDKLIAIGERNNLFKLTELCKA